MNTLPPELTPARLRELERFAKNIAANQTLLHSDRYAFRQIAAVLRHQITLQSPTTEATP